MVASLVRILQMRVENFEFPMQIRNNSGSKPRRQSLDLQELLMSSPPWPPAASSSPDLKDFEKESVSSDWVDKIMINKQELERRGGNILGWEEDGRQSPDMFFQRQNTRSLTATPDDSDDPDAPDATTSDSSEPDFLWQPNNVHNKVTNVPTNGNASKLRKPSPKHRKSPETRYIVNNSCFVLL